MARRLAATRVSWLAGLLVLTGCQGIQPYLPRDETPVMPPAFAVEVPRGPSSQRLNERGYPMLGHMPRAATQQANPQTVADAQSRYSNVSTRGSAPTSAGVSDLQGLATRNAAAARTSEYQRSIEELRAIAEAQRSSSANR